MSTLSRTTGEILAPAGDQASLEAALAAGADAVYFGLDEGFNARARASNFRMETLPEVVGMVHRAGARAYLALNTLVFEDELPKLEEILRSVARSGVDALIVQDPGLALLAKAICPDLELHASTQMTISSPEGAAFAEGLGITRVVVPRELSVNEIRTFREGTELELEAFIMGALCVSWSGQCLSSEAWGGRSANRGRCAQACRLPYELVVDEEVKPLGDVSYLLSPQDLAGFRAVEDLLEIGVHTLKIEGRQKGAEYVHHAVDSMRRWVDSVRSGNTDEQRLAEDLRDLTVVYSRGFGDGFLAGSDHQTLVEGRSPRHRGLFLGTVVDVQRHKVIVDPAPLIKAPGHGVVSSPPKRALGGSPEAATGAATAIVEPQAGMGVVFSQGDEQENEQGGPIFRVDQSLGDWALTFGRPGPDLRQVKRGAHVYVTSDPKLALKKVQTPHCRLPLRLEIQGKEGSVLTVRAMVHQFEAESESQVALQPAQKRELDRAVLEENLGALGGTPFHLAEMSLDLPPGLFLPLGQLRDIRRDIVEQLEPWITEGSGRRVRSAGQLTGLHQATEPREAGTAYLVALCRNEAHLEAAIESGVNEVELDWMELVALNKAVARAREAGLKVGLATVRIQKPGEQVYDLRLEKLSPDAILLRHWGGVMHFRDLEDRPTLHGDFSLNVTNSLTANYLLHLGLETVTASHDLDQDQLRALLKAVDPARVAVTVHHHIPTFHTEHCVYSHLLSEGRDYLSCGRPCEKHEISLKDRVGLEHPVIVDVGCRNTVFNALAQSGAFLMPELSEVGVRRFRVEFVRENQEDARRVLEGYGQLLRGDITIAELIGRIQVHEQFGVTRGTMKLIE